MGGGLVLVLPARRFLRGGEAPGSHSDQDRHKAPTSAPPRPLSLQGGERPVSAGIEVGRKYSSSRGLPLPGFSINEMTVLLTAGEDGSRHREYSFVRDPSLAEEWEYA